jgi:putative ABC transport system ATP-binding protein
MFGINFLHNPTQTAYEKISSEYAIDLEDVEKEFETPAGKFKALKGITLQVKPGNFVSVIGKSGSGKSTLINMLTGIDRPTAGKAYVGGAAIHKMNEEQIAIWRGITIGVVFQFFQLLPTLSAVENVMLAMDYANIIPRKERPDRAMQVLEEMGMAQYAHSMPGALSGGQQQVIAIARALANDPPIITADEPTGNLDVRTADSVFDLFKKLADNGKTIMMVTHDNELASRAGRTVVISDGRVIDDYINQH